jgi:MFS family permease
MPPLGLRASIRSTRDSAFRLAQAHLDLAKAEAASIADEVKKVAAYVGIAIAVVIFAVILAVIGTSLFVGEWLLGSIGWGVLHGVLLFIAIAVSCALAAVGVGGARIGRSFLVGLLLAVVVGVLMALGLPNQAYTYVGDNALPGIEPGVRPLVVGMIIIGLIGLIVGAIAAARGGGVGALLAGLVAGVVIGAISATTPGYQVGAGIGIAVGYITWIALMITDVATTGVDVDALKARFTPTQTIETSKETLAWLQSKMPPGTGS